jgi:hypothetical protein
MKGNKGGKTLNDRKLAANVRTLALKEIERILLGDDEVYKKEIVLKLTPTLLPRLQEHTGEDGKELPQPLLYVLHNHSDQKDIQPEETD